MSWDETAVLVAVRGYSPYFTVVGGRMICHDNGSNGWDTGGTRDQYLVRKMPVVELEKEIDELMMHQPQR